MWTDGSLGEEADLQSETPVRGVAQEPLHVSAEEWADNRIILDHDECATRVGRGHDFGEAPPQAEFTVGERRVDPPRASFGGSVRRKARDRKPP